MTITIKRLGSWPRELSRKRGIKRGNVDYAKTRLKLIEHLREMGAKEALIGVALDSVSQTGWPNAGTRPQFPGVCLVVDSTYGQLIFSCDKFSVWTHNLRAIVDTLEGAHRMIGLGTVEPERIYGAFQWEGLSEWISKGGFTGDIGQAKDSGVSDSAKKPKPKAGAAPGARAKTAAPPPSGSSRTSAPPPPPPPRTPPPRTPTNPRAKETFETRAQAAEWLALQTGTPRAHILATEEVFLSAYRKAARSLHPDVGGDPAQFRRLQNAKATIERGAAWAKAA